MTSFDDRRLKTAGATPPDVGLGILLREANIAFNRVLRARRAEHGVTFGQFQHLRHLWDEDGLSQAELSRRIGIERASSTAVLDSLEAAGLIRRERDAADRRRLIVFPTPQGRSLRGDLWACARAANADARPGLEPDRIGGGFDALGPVIRH